jgi:hypothetical protein
MSSITEAGSLLSLLLYSKLISLLDEESLSMVGDPAARHHGANFDVDAVVELNGNWTRYELVRVCCTCLRVVLMSAQLVSVEAVKVASARRTSMLIILQEIWSFLLLKLFLHFL